MALPSGGAIPHTRDMTTTVQTVTITRPNLKTGRPVTRTMFIESEWASYTGTAIGRPVVLVNEIGHKWREHHVLSEDEQKTITVKEV